MSFIYKITNKVSSKCYIGKTDYVDPTTRYKEHIRESRKSRNKNRPLYSAIRKHGEDSFIFSVIEETDKPSEREIYYINYFDSFGSNGYNATKGGDGKAYLAFTDKEVIDEFKTTNSTMKTAETLHIDRHTVKSILGRNNIATLSRKEIADKYSGKAVIQLDKNSGLVLNTFNTINDAARFLGGLGKNRQITRALRGEVRYALGYEWKFSK